MNTIRLLWKHKIDCGSIRAVNAVIESPSGVFSGNSVRVVISEAAIGPGPFSAMIQVETDKPFSFFLRDVSEQSPIYLPTCEAVVTTGGDLRTFDQIVEDIAAKGGRSKQQRARDEDEYDFARAAAETRDLPGPAWLGVSKDLRFFQVGMRSKASGNDSQIFDEISPLFLWQVRTKEQFPEFAGRNYVLSMMTGRGLGCRHRISKRLEDGCLPILRTVDIDDDITYHGTFFASLETKPLDTAHLEGTDMYAADACGVGNMFTPEQQKLAIAARDAEFFREEQTVLYVRIVAENTAKAPTYAFLKMPDPLLINEEDGKPEAPAQQAFSPETGSIRLLSNGRVCVIGTLNGRPVPAQENALLLQPGEQAVFEFYIPHSPIPPERAVALSKTSFDDKLAEAKRFWNSELSAGADIRLPEKRIEEMIRTGLLHLDVAYFGRNPDGPVVPVVGAYTAIGSESAPGIQFLDAMGWNQLAGRALQFFVEKQHEDGFIQNFNGYMLETGSVLWSMCEHWRLTRDEAWLSSVQTCIEKAADYLIRWREKNMDEALKGGKGYGMIEGKVADPEDDYHSFMLNAGAYAGLRGAGEVLEALCPEKATLYTQTAAAMRDNIRESFARSLALGPAVPTGNGTWIRSFSVWPEYIGPMALYAQGGRWFTHGSFMIRDILGATYLILQGVIDADEPMGREILAFHSEFMTSNNTAFSQPYYSPHPYGQLLCGDVEQFLQEFYCGVAGLADRETYSFWEHYYHASPHKLHEEAWFLMRCRWMLALEEYDRGLLRMLAGIPRAWMQDGQPLSIRGLKTYYGNVDLTVQSDLTKGKISILLTVNGEGFPKAKKVSVRVPHPTGQKAKAVTAGSYDAATETVTFVSPSDTIMFDVLY